MLRKMFFSIFIFFYTFLFNSSVWALKIGVTAGPHAIIMTKVKDLASFQGLNIEIIEFNDFITPNEALNQRDLDANSYQHFPFLQQQIQARGYDLTSLGKTVLMPMALYSNKFLSIKDLPKGAKIALPNDPTNGGRALLLLEKAGFIQLSKEADPSLLTITANPLELQLIEIDAPQLPRLLEEVDAAVINTDWIVLAGFDPQKNLIQEVVQDSPYSNIIAIKSGQESNPELIKFLTIYQSSDVKNYLQETFKGAIIPAW